MSTESREIEHRIVLGRVLQHLTQMEQSARAARQLVQDAVSKIDGNRTAAQPPVAREMIIRALREGANQGLTRAEIMSGIHRDYGVEMAPNTATTTLLRMRKAGLARKSGLFWFLREEALET
jgi:hypothetical protein